MCNKRRGPAYKASSFFEIFGGTTTHFPCVYLNVEVGLGVNILDLVDSWLQLPAFEDRRGVTGRVEGHRSGRVWRTRASHSPIMVHWQRPASATLSPRDVVPRIGRGISKRFPRLVLGSHSW